MEEGLVKSALGFIGKSFRYVGELRMRLIGAVRDDVDDTQWPAALSSRFVREKWELRCILKMRKTFFEKIKRRSELSSDESYWKAFERNNYAFSIVSERREPFGYWGLVPVSKKDFDRFVAGEVSHDEMLRDCTISWMDADPDELYLYHIGVVTMTDAAEKLRTTAFQVNAAKIVRDIIAVLFWLHRLGTIKGIALYPSTEEGSSAIQHWLKNKGFVGTGELVDERDPIQEVHVLNDDKVDQFFASWEDNLARLRVRSDDGRNESLGETVWSHIDFWSDFRPRVPQRDRKQIDHLAREIQLGVETPP
ncbi:MAG: hypothetical protein AAFU65_02430 [Pseudomonadota bacterium]